jgi:hypothetical protein
LADSAGAAAVALLLAKELNNPPEAGEALEKRDPDDAGPPNRLDPDEAAPPNKLDPDDAAPPNKPDPDDAAPPNKPDPDDAAPPNKLDPDPPNKLGFSNDGVLVGASAADELPEFTLLTRLLNIPDPEGAPVEYMLLEEPNNPEPVLAVPLVAGNNELPVAAVLAENKLPLAGLLVEKRELPVPAENKEPLEELLEPPNKPLDVVALLDAKSPLLLDDENKELPDELPNNVVDVFEVRLLDSSPRPALSGEAVLLAVLSGCGARSGLPGGSSVAVLEPSNISANSGSFAFIALAASKCSLNLAATSASPNFRANCSACGSSSA